MMRVSASALLDSGHFTRAGIMVTSTVSAGAIGLLLDEWSGWSVAAIAASVAGIAILLMLCGAAVLATRWLLPLTSSGLAWLVPFALIVVPVSASYVLMYDQAKHTAGALREQHKSSAWILEHQYDKPRPDRTETLQPPPGWSPLSPPDVPEPATMLLCAGLLMLLLVRRRRTRM